MSEKLAVIFGGSGFVGRNVVRVLAQQGWRVRVAVRRPHHAGFLRPMGVVGQVSLAQVNVRHQPSVTEAMRGADAVVNLVGILHQEGAQKFNAVHVDGARAIASAAAEAGVSRFVQMSAITADENSESAYARSKARGERAVREVFPSATILRPSIIFGPEDDFFNRFAQMATIAPALPLFGGGETKMQPVYVCDVARAVLAALESDVFAGHEYALGGPCSYSFRELMELMLREIGRKRFLAPVPFFMGPAIGLMGELVGSLPIFTPPITRDQVRSLKADMCVPEGAKTLSDLGIDATALEAVLPSYMVQYRQYGQFADRVAN